MIQQVTFINRKILILIAVGQRLHGTLIVTLTTYIIRKFFVDNYNYSMHYFQETYASLLLVSQFIYLFLIISICYWSQSCGKLTGYVGLGCLLDNLMGTTRNYNRQCFAISCLSGYIPQQVRYLHFEHKLWKSKLHTQTIL